MDLNQLHFDHQPLLRKARRTLSAEARRALEVGTSRLAGCIGGLQRAFGAAATPAFRPAPVEHHSLAGYADTRLARAIADAKRARLNGEQR